ncbi:MAG: hypothetical protein ACI3Z9_06535 [Candidatus Onthomorpha sp.]
MYFIAFAVCIKGFELLYAILSKTGSLFSQLFCPKKAIYLTKAKASIDFDTLKTSFLIFSEIQIKDFKRNTINLYAK